MNEKDLDPRQSSGYLEIDLRKLAEPFDPKEVDFRIGQAGAKDGEPWAKVLAYIDARAVMDRLDEVVGPGNWKDRYWKEGEGVMCGLAIKVNGEWVEKIDGSEETDIEAFKGGISKALVRTAVKWQIGRYLYRLGDGWAQIVPSGTKDARWQPADKQGKYKAFNWLPPALPEWAVPKPKAAPVTSGVAAKTATAQQGIKERLNERKENSVPKAGQGQAGKASPLERIDQGIGEFFDAATGPNLRGEVLRDGPANEAANPGQVPENALHIGAAREGNGGSETGAAAKAQDRAPGSGDKAPQATDRNGAKPGALRQERPVAGAGAAKDTPTTRAGSTSVQRLRQDSRDEPNQIGEHALPGRAASLPEGPASDGSDLRDGTTGRAGEPVPGGASEATPEGSQGAPGEPERPAAGKVKAIPQSKEEIEWFVEYMKNSLKDVKTMAQLSELWTTNIAAIKSLEPKYQSQVIIKKDESKARLKK